MVVYAEVSERILRELEGIVGSEYLSTRPEELYCYSKDSTIFQFKPNVVVRPRTAEQVAGVLQLANREKIPTTPRGAGTSAAGSPLPVMGGILLDMSAMNRILSIELDNQLVEVEPGVICDTLNEALHDHGFFFPPDPASSLACTLGGMVSCNAAGNRAMKYGPTRNYVLWLEVVTGAGEVVNTGTRTLKSVSDFDLTSLMVGSEGSLGVITKMCLKIVPQPKQYATAMAIYDTAEALARSARKIRLAGIIPEMLEFMDENTTEAAFEYARVTGLPAGNFLLIDCGGSKEAVSPMLESCLSLCKEDSIYVERAENTEYREKLITARKAAFPALARRRPSTILEDCTVPLSKLAEAAAKIAVLPRQLAVDGVDIGNFGHIGDGNMHPTFTLDLRVQEQRSGFLKGLDVLYKDIVLPMGGSLTGEHGIGLTRAPYIELAHGSTIHIMRQLKQLFDPHLILNPGKGKGGPYPLSRA